ncbi:MAG: hypothetical protein AB1643_00725 [Patescibacteria group bacterium]
MGIFEPNKPKVSSKEFKEVESFLSVKGLSKLQRNKVKEIFRGDLDESSGFGGIDAEEVKKGIEWMRKNKSVHGISKEKIDKIEEALRKKL